MSASHLASGNHNLSVKNNKNTFINSFRGEDMRRKKCIFTFAQATVCPPALRRCPRIRLLWVNILCMSTHTHKHTHYAHKPTCTHGYMHAHTHTCMHVCAYACTHTHTHMCAQTHTHTHTHTHTCWLKEYCLQWIFVEWTSEAVISGGWLYTLLWVIY